MSSDIEPALFAGRTALVTSADQGLGAVVVKRLAQLGATAYGTKNIPENILDHNLAQNTSLKILCDRLFEEDGKLNIFLIGDRILTTIKDPTLWSAS